MKFIKIPPKKQNGVNSIMSKIASIKVVEKEKGYQIITEKVTASGKKQVQYFKENGKNKIFTDEVQAEVKKAELVQFYEEQKKDKSKPALSSIAGKSKLSLKKKTLSLAAG